MRLRQRGTHLFMAGLVALSIGAVTQAARAQEVNATAVTPPISTADGPAVLTHHNDNARTGANLLETTLNVNNVNPNTFGKLFSRQVDGEMYAQPLYVPGVMIGGKKRNILIVATMHSSVYAFDADDPNANDPLWKTSFLDDKKGIYPCPIWEVGGGDTNIWPEVGIVSTPVVDIRNRFILCVTKTKEVTAAGTRYPSRLRKLDLLTGKEIAPSGLEIQATVPGKGDGANADGTLTFDAARQMNRPGLLLQNDIVYIAFGSHSDITPYHGWVFAYQTKHLTPMAVWCSTPNGKTDPSGYPIGAGGIWMSGQGLVADPDNNVYLEVGNGTFSANTKDGVDFGDSFVKLHLFSNGRGYSLLPVDYFTPYEQDWLNRVDADLGVTGPMLIPDSNLVVGGGKGGKLYLLNRNNMGGFSPNGDTQIPQWLWTFPQHLHGSPVYWKSSVGSLVYVWGELDYLKAYKVDPKRQTFFTTPFAMSAMRAPIVESGMPGATLSVSANGVKTGTGIVWANLPWNDDAIHKIVPGVLRAFDASNLKELWNSKMVADRDDFGLFAKFTPPTIANGKVYMATFSNQIFVYGLGKWVAIPTINPQSGEYRQSVTVSITDTTPGAAVYYTLDGSDPTQTSARYTKPFTVSQSTIVRARAYATGILPSPIATAKYLIDNGPGTGDGLLGSYYNNLNFDGAPVTRVDPTVNFPNWGGVMPIAGVGPDNWTCRWTGTVQPRATGNYTFTTVSDDGVRLWVNGQLLVDNWTYHGSTENSGTIKLEQSKKYDIRMEYFEGGGGAVAELLWASDFIDRQIIPQSQLYSK